ncbi:MAG: hypothetical protein ACR2L2_00785 [Acidobacteriota bacterium]
MQTVHDPLRRGLKLGFRETFYPLGGSLVVESNRVAVLEAARESFNRYPRVSDTPDYRIRLLVDPEFCEKPPWPSPVFRGHGEIFHIQVGRESFAQADLGRRTAMGFVSAALAGDTAFFRSMVLECLYFVMATYSQHTYLHASAVASEEKAIILAGPRCAGKSTLAYACGKQGLDVLSDDVVYIEQSGRGRRAPAPMRMWGKPWHLKLLPDAVRFFPELNSLEPRIQINNEFCLEVRLDDFLPGRAVVCAEPVAVFFLERGGVNAVHLETLMADAAYSRMEADLVLDSDKVMEQHRGVWRKLAALPAFRLIAAEDPHVTARFLKDRIQGSGFRGQGSGTMNRTSGN